jgi:hypothetical protein
MTSTDSGRLAVTVSAATDTASMTIPVAADLGRAGFGPSLSLTCDSPATGDPWESLTAGTTWIDLSIVRKGVPRCSLK